MVVALKSLKNKEVLRRFAAFINNAIKILKMICYKALARII